MSKYNCKYNYRFEVNRETADSLNSAIKIMSSNDKIQAIYNLPSGDRPASNYEIELDYQNISNRNEQEILDLLDSEVDSKHFEQK